MVSWTPTRRESWLMTTDDRQVVAVLAGGESSLAPAEVVACARGLAQVCFLLDSRGTPPQLQTVTQSLAPTAQADFADPQSCLRAVGELGARSVTTFTDVLCPLAAEINGLLSGVSRDGPAWGKKDAQRAALFAAGLSAVRSAPVESARALGKFVREVGYPVVVKPVNGVASRDVWILRSDADVAGLLATAASHPRYLSRMFAEQFITGTSPSSSQLGDYVSAELFRASGTGRASPPKTVQAFITDRIVPAWPCRETGLMLPSQLPESVQDAALNVASSALQAIGACAGAFHVELKPALPAPEIIEINGRLGGFIARLAHLGADADLGRLALECALGRSPSLILRWRRCVLALLFQAPATATRINAAPSRREITRLPGVIAVDSVAAPGPAPDWRDGTNQAVAKLWLAADDHSALFARLAGLAEFLAENFSFEDAHGRPAEDRQWLQAVCGN